MPFHVSPQEVALIVILALLFFGPRKLPELARGVGEAIREFRGSVSNPPKEAEKLPPPTVATTEVKEAKEA